MASKVDIANQALDLLGQPVITAFTDDNETARLVKRQYELSRDTVQQMYPWRETKHRTNLAKDASAPAFGYSYRYLLPADCLRIVEVYDSDKARLLMGWEREGEYILTDKDSPIYVRYLKRLEDTAKWTPLLAQVVAAHMAYSMCERFTQSARKKREMLQWLNLNYTTARKANGQEGTPAHLNEPDRWEAVRWSGGFDSEARPISEAP